MRPPLRWRAAGLLTSWPCRPTDSSRRSSLRILPQVATSAPGSCWAAWLCRKSLARPSDPSQRYGSRMAGDDRRGERANDRMRVRQGLPGYHDPTAGIGGAAPARSALTLRLWLALFGLVSCMALAIWLAWLGAPTALVVVLVLFAVVALVDIGVIVRRKRRGEPGCPSPSSRGRSGRVARNLPALGVGGKGVAEIEKDGQADPEPVEPREAARTVQEHVDQRRERQEEEAEKRPDPRMEGGIDQVGSCQPDDQQAESRKQTGEHREQAPHDCSLRASSRATLSSSRCCRPHPRWVTHRLLQTASSPGAAGDGEVAGGHTPRSAPAGPDRGLEWSSLTRISTRTTM